MTDLFEKSIQILELPQVLEMLANQSVTQEGEDKAVTLRPMTDPDDVQRAQEETSAAVAMLTLRGTPALSGVKPVGARGFSQRMFTPAFAAAIHTGACAEGHVQQSI